MARDEPPKLSAPAWHVVDPQPRWTDERLMMKILREDRLDSLPGIGKSLSQDLVDLGCRRVSDLRDLDAEQLYQSLQKLRGTLIDRCVLYAFRCAIYCASNDDPHPDLQKWWNWKDNDTRAV